MEEIIGYFFAVIFGIYAVIQIGIWLWTAPKEFVRLLRLGPNPKLTFVFIGMGVSVASLLLLQFAEVWFMEYPHAYFIAVGASAGFAGIMFQIFRKSKYPTVSYFFIIIFKILLVIVPTIFISIITDNLVWGLTYFFIMLLITFHSVYRIRTKPSNYSGTSVNGIPSQTFSSGQVIKYLASSIFQAAMGYFVSMGLSELIG